MKSPTILAMVRDDSGATLVEYSLVIGLISIACFVAVSYLGQRINHMLNVWGSW